MALGGRGAAPACILLLLAFLPSWDTQTGPQEKPAPGDHTFILSRNNLKEMIKVLEHRIQFLHQKHLMLEHTLPEKQDKAETVHVKDLKGCFVREKAPPSSLTTQEIPFPNSFSVLVGNKLHKISPNILTDIPVRHNKVKGAVTEEDKKERTLLSGLKQDKNAGNSGGRSLTTTNITLRFHSADNSSKTQIDIYNLKDSREVPDVHIVVSNIISEGINIDSVVLKDNGLQMIVNSSVDKKLISEKGRRKSVIKPNHGMARENITEDSKKNLPVKGQKDSSQNITRQEMGTSVEELGRILNFLSKGNEKQKSSLPNEKMQASVMETILQELQEPKSPEEEDSSEDKHKMPMESFPKRSQSVQVSDELSLKQLVKATPVPNLRTGVANEDVKDGKRFEFFEKYEGIQDKSRAKAAALKDLLEYIVITCVAVTSLILAVIVLVHICTSLSVKRKQNPVITNIDICKKDRPDKSEVTSLEEKRSKQLEDDTGDIENQNNNNLAVFPSTDIVRGNEEDIVVKLLEIQPIENTSFSCSLLKETGLLSPAESLQELPDYSSPSHNSTCKNLKVKSGTFETNYTSYDNPEHGCKPEGHGCQLMKKIHTALYRKQSNHQRFSRQKLKSTEPKRPHINCTSKHQCCSNSRRVGNFSSNVSITLDTNENTNESRLTQHDDSQCACFLHLKCSSSTDSYSD